MSKPLRIDIISDVVCPWCAVGYYQLKRAIDELELQTDIHWHPFQLNPDMPPEGQNLREHLAKKYGVTAEQSVGNRDRITTLGAEVGFTFNFFDEMRTYNTLRAHQLIHWAREHDKESEMKLALLGAYFTNRRDIYDLDILIDIANQLGLDGSEARKVLEEETHADIVREHMTFWSRQGITGVPAVVIDSRYLVSGAAGVEHFKQALTGAQKD